MALSIKNQQTEKLAREIAKQTGETLTQAIEKSLEERLQRLRLRGRERMVAKKIKEILSRVDAMPNLDTRSEDEIIGYDEHGVPR